MSPVSDREEAAHTSSLVLMSTLSAAAEITSGMMSRRRGEDPSDQETAEVALHALHESLAELQDHLLALRLAGVARESRDDRSVFRFARALNEVLLLGRCTRVMHAIHQRLLSLYPRMPEDLIEESRRLELLFTAAQDDLGEAHDPGFLERAELFAADTLALRPRT